MNQGTQFYPLLSAEASGMEIQNFSLIGDALCPPYMQPRLRGTFKKYRDVDLYTIPDVSRGNYAPANASGWEYDFDTYNCSGRAQKVTWTYSEFSDELRDRPQDAIFRESTMLKTKDLRLAHELEVQTMFTTQANYLAANIVNIGSTYGVFDNYALTINPVEIVQKCAALCRGTYNTIAMGADVARAIRFHPNVRGMFGAPGLNGGGTQLITDEVLKFLLFNGRTSGVRLLIGEGEYNTASDKTTATLGRFWEDTIFIGYISEEQGEAGLHSYSRNMAYDAPLGGGSTRKRASTTNYYRVRSFDEEAIGGGAFSLEVDRFVNPKITFKPYGVYLHNIMT